MFASNKSQNLREHGNKLYREAQKEGLPLVIHKDRLEKALMSYTSALESSIDSIEKSSALKNIGLTSIKLFHVSLKVGERKSTTEYYLQDGIAKLDLALYIGQSGGQTQQWRDSLHGSYMDYVNLLISHLSKKNQKDRCNELEMVAWQIKDKQAKSLLLHEATRLYFNSSVVALEAGDYQSCLSILGECHRPLEEIKSCKKNSDNSGMEVIEDLAESVFFQQCRAWSLQARQEGDLLLEKSVKDSENLHMDAVYTVIDIYKNAILLTKEVEVEMEAIALSRLGDLYDRILKDETRAKDNFMKSLQLASSLHPKIFHHEEWYKLAANGLKKYQTEFRKNEEESEAKERAPYVEELKNEMEELKKQEEKGAKDLLEYIYKTWPPKNEAHKIAELTTDPRSQKLALKKAILHYHPDKQDTKINGMKWCVFTEEITKVLNKKYYFFKFD